MNFEGKQQSLLTFRVGPVLCCAPSAPVRSIITPPKLTQAPGSDLSQPGIFRYRSHIVKVHDLRQKFGIEQQQQTQPGNLIITLFKIEAFAFWVDQILDVIDFPSQGWADLPSAIPRGVFSRTLLLNKKIYLYADIVNFTSINNLGYLRPYIQQITKQENPRNIDKQQENVEIKPASAIGLNEPQENLKPESKTTQTVINKTAKQTDKAIDIKQRVNRPLVTQTNINKPATISAKKTSQYNPILEKLTQKKPVFITQQKSKPYEKPAPITRKIFSSETSVIKNDISNESSSLWMFLLFVFLLISLATSVYYLFDSTSTTNYKYNQKKPTTLTLPQADDIIKKATISYRPKLDDMPLLAKSLNLNTKLTNTQTDEDNEAINLKNKNINIEPEQKNKVSTKERSIFNNKEALTSQAKIIQKESDITITLHEDISNKSPRQEATLNTKKKNSVSSEVSPKDNLLQKNMSQIIIKEEISREVIHVIVKGDTLWDIAKKYVKDPLLYPELARLSKIKNPHRIFPGNRVRIRFIKN